MPTIRRILERKGSQVWTIRPDETVYEALCRMAERGVGALVVTQGGRICGMLSERDYARKIRLFNRSSKNTMVSEIMTPEVVTGAADWDLERCLRMMTQQRFRHLPIVEDGRLVGLVSMGDVVAAIIEHQHYMIQDLTSYVGMGGSEGA